MIDYTKVNNLPISAEEILANELLTFPLSNVATTGEILSRAQVANFGNMDFVVKGAYVKLKGSYQKHAQSGTNYQDFTFTDIKQVIEKLVNLFHFDPKLAYYNFIEIGVNIKVSTDPTRLIKSFLRYKQKEFEPLPIIGAGFGRQCQLQQFTIKAYNKSLQYGLPFHLLRFEVKVTRMEYLKLFGINNLSMCDLTKPDVYPKLQKVLLDILGQILLHNPDFSVDSLMNAKDRELILQTMVPNYLNALPRATRMRKISRFTELVGADRLKNELKQLITEKWNELTTLQIDPTITDSEKTKRINTTINGYSRTCPITKVDISMQKGISHLLSNTGLTWLKQNDPTKYEIIRRCYLPTWGVSGLHTKFEDDEISHLAKQIRNEYYNRRRYMKKIPANQLQLL